MSRSSSDATGGRQRPLVHGLLKLCRGLTLGLDYSARVIAVTAMAVMFTLLLMNVVLRYIFTTGIPMAYEIHAVLLPWLVAGGLVVASARNRNIAVTLLPDMMSPTARRLVLMVVQGIVLLIAVSIVWSGQPILRASTFQSLSTLGVKQVWGYASLPYSFACISVIATCDLLRLILRDETLEESLLTPTSLS
ncbi:TRAP transporter small permease [Ponticoccus alexandrii]|uniref:TRAP transporter small permease protein n=1 Tax=Ponticoccus alexandrii TaxID=1943633 RepID=A0ABX7FH02_9RHOB|nr:TRAP transporter small permease [Ponticoccus alexandrii]QRF69196.1 TRAP transporter small permease subunit [Ponticoccus alexandrii]